MADAACMRRVAEIVVDYPATRQAVVLSACKGVTDDLLNLIAQAERNDMGWNTIRDALRVRHVKLVEALLLESDRAGFLERFESDLQDIAAIAQTAMLLKTAPQTMRDVVAGYGELWSSRVFARFVAADKSLAAKLGKVVWLDARHIVTVNWGPLGPTVDWTQSANQLAQHVPEDFVGTLIIPGFVASNSDGTQTTLGRNGSDFSGAIFGALLHASDVVIWTDVDGVLSADPRSVPEPKVIPRMSYHEAMELAYFGAKVIHPQTMVPAVSLGIPIHIRNTFAPDHPGTVICAPSEAGTASEDTPVKGVTFVGNMALINVEGAGMIGVPGVAHRLFGALREADISVSLISQASSEHSICIAVPHAQIAAAKTTILQAFDQELRQGQIQSVEVTDDCSVVAVVGDHMAGSPNTAAKMFTALGKAGVNVRAIAQGASERNISAVVDSAHALRAVRAIHSSFYLSPHTVSIGLIGPGLVGGVLLDQLALQLQRLSATFGLDLRIRGIASSSKMLLSKKSVSLSKWRDEVAAESVAFDWDKFVDHIQPDHLPNAVLIDCTASEAVAARYLEWMSRGIHVVTPNKKAASGDMEYFQHLMEAKRRHGTRFLYEANVGAGLPILSTLRDLRETGDEIYSIEGILSGTLAYIFSTYDGTQPFSSVIKTAKEKGLTEPDPRDDLSGQDIARKLTILGREMGCNISLADVKVQGLVPPALQALPLADFMAQLSKLDEPMQQQLQSVRNGGKILRYVGRVDREGHATVGLTVLNQNDRFAAINPTDNIVRFTTRRYNDNPLIVQGPGAGPDVTAAGVFADLLRLCGYIGANV